ncbi:MAG: hypothetical protein WA988_19740 [Candidatus Nanopelagicales bacterium]
MGVAVACLTLSALAVHRTDGTIPDDAFITFRYAQNLIDGHGWVYNIDHPTANAASAPLYTLGLALFGIMFGSVERAATLLFVFTTAASGYLAFAILRNNSMTLGGIAAMCLIIINHGCSPPEDLKRPLSCAYSYCLGARKPMALGFVLVAATFVRGDAAVLASLVFALLWIQAKRIPVRLMIGGAAAAILWTITTLVFSIPIVPSTLAAKMAPGRSGLWSTLYARGFFGIPKWFGMLDWATMTMLPAGTGLLLLGGLRELRRYLGPFIVAVAGIFAAYGLIIRPPTYHWYYGPQLALMALCSAVTIAVLARAASANVAGHDSWKPDPARITRLGSFDNRARMATATAMAVTIFMTGAVCAFGWRDIGRGLGPTTYLRTASWLDENTPERATVALTEIGIVGWYSKREMIDFLGLLSTDSVHEIAAHDSVSWLTREEPDYWVLHQPQWPGMTGHGGRSE